MKKIISFVFLLLITSALYSQSKAPVIELKTAANSVTEFKLSGGGTGFIDTLMETISLAGCDSIQMELSVQDSANVRLVVAPNGKFGYSVGDTVAIGIGTASGGHTVGAGVISYQWHQILKALGSKATMGIKPIIRMEKTVTRLTSANKKATLRVKKFLR